jgi:hypothetical protein
MWVKNDALHRVRWTMVDIYMRRQYMRVAGSVAWIDRRGLTAVVH